MSQTTIHDPLSPAGRLQQRRITAEHEAAHAVLYIDLGCGLYEAVLEDDFEGSTRSSPKPRSMPGWDYAAISAAGVVIEDRYVFQPLEQRWAAENDDAYDDGYDDEDGGDLYGIPWGLALTGYQQACITLDRLADMHRAIADALYEHSRVTADDVRALGYEVTDWRP